MLPKYASDAVHHRPGLIGAVGSQFHGRSMSSYGGHRTGKKSTFTSILQAALLLCVLLPLWLLAADRMGKSSGAKAASTTGGRRMLDASTAGSVLPPPAAYLQDLVLVAGHAVYTGLDYSVATLESSWFLEDYQKVPGEAQSFLDHIALGIAEAAKNPEAMLLFSGGQTRQAAGPRSEGLSYWLVAEAAAWYNNTQVRNRTFTEEHARDSFENLLFSLCRFYELTGHYPRQVTVVSYTLKRDRFFTIHRGALRFPMERFKFVGTDVPPGAMGAKEGEARTVEAFKQNPYGCQGELLQKKLRRDPFAVGPPHPSRCPDMREIITYCSTELFEGKVPWS